MPDFADRYVLGKGCPVWCGDQLGLVEDRSCRPNWEEVWLDCPPSLDVDNCPPYHLVLERDVPIQSKIEHEQMLQAVEALFNAPANSVARRILVQMVLLIEAYEHEHYPIPEPTPEAMAELRAEMERTEEPDAKGA